jgi:hypothetical protein
MEFLFYVQQKDVMAFPHSVTYIASCLARVYGIPLGIYGLALSFELSIPNDQ